MIEAIDGIDDEVLIKVSKSALNWVEDALYWLPAEAAWELMATGQETFFLSMWKEDPEMSLELSDSTLVMKRSFFDFLDLQGSLWRNLSSDKDVVAGKQVLENWKKAKALCEKAIGLMESEIEDAKERGFGS